MAAAVRATLVIFVTFAACGQCLRLQSPPPDAHPDSAYIAIEGSATRAALVAVLENGAAVASLRADADGHFERVLRLSAGAHTLQFETGGCASARATMTIPAQPSPPANAPFELMRAADVILAHNRESAQDAIYTPTYTHSALYIGSAPNGAARILEAVAEQDATSRGPVAGVPIEDSLAFRFGDRIDLFRATPAISAGDRSRMVAWSRRIAAQGLPFWSNQDFGDVYRAFLLWDAAAGRPRDSAAFDELLRAMHQRMDSTSAFDCATLVWHAYRDNTATHFDPASPNLVQFGGVAQAVPAALAAILRPWIIVPDSFALSGKLEQVRAQ